MGEVALLQGVMTRAPSTNPTQDVAICTFHLESFADFWSGTSAAVIEGFFATWLPVVKVYWDTWLTFKEWRWYRLDGSGHTTGSPFRVTAVGVPGTGTGGTGILPPQAAMTVTEIASSRRRWGRFYLPVTKVTLTSSARFSSSIIDAVADATEILYESAWDSVTSGHFVTRPRLDGSFEDIHEIQIDDIVDIQRRRRWEMPSIRDRRNFID